MTALGPGVRVKCIVPNWFDLGGKCAGPSLGSVWTVAKVIHVPPDRAYLNLAEWTANRRDLWRSTAFIPMDGNEDISALEGLLKKGPVERDAPARKRELERAK